MAGNENKVGKETTFEGNKVPRLTKFLYPFSGIFRDACYALVGSFLLTYAMTTGVLSSNPDVYSSQYGIITIAMMIALIWDGINDPIMGFIIEKVHFKAGKFRPWILIGAIGNAVAVALMFLVRLEGVADGWAFVGCMIAFYFLWDLFFTMNDVGYWSMLPSLSNDEGERASLTSRVTLCASIGGFVMTGACFLLPTAFVSMGLSAGRMYGIIAIIISILFLVLSCLALVAGVVFLLLLLLKKKRKDGDSHNGAVKTMSLAGLLPIRFLISHYFDPIFVAIYVIAALAVGIWIAVLVIFLLRKKGKKPEPEAPEAEEPADSATPKI